MKIAIALLATAFLFSSNVHADEQKKEGEQKSPDKAESKDKKVDNSGRDKKGDEKKK